MTGPIPTTSQIRSVWAISAPHDPDGFDRYLASRDQELLESTALCQRCWDELGFSRVCWCGEAKAGAE